MRSSVYEVTTAPAPAAISPRDWPRRAVVPAIVTTGRPGANRAASAAQLDTTLVGATIRKGGRPGSASRARQMSARDWSVLPRPMSSARMPPSWCRHRKASQPNPSRW